MKFYPLLTIILLCCATTLSAQTTFSKRYLGRYQDMGDGYDLKQLPDGSYLVAGTTSPGEPSYRNFIAIKISPRGDTLWNRIIGGLADDYGYSLALTQEGGCAVAGYTESFGMGLKDFYVVRLKANGDTLWTRAIGGSSDDIARSIVRTADNGFIVAGDTRSFGAANEDILVVRLDSNGEVKWSMRYVSPYAEYGYKAVLSLDGSITIAGYETISPTDEDAVVIKTDSLGNVRWARRYGVSANDTTEQRAYSIVRTSDGYAFAGVTQIDQSLPYARSLLVKLDSLGNVTWSTAFGLDNNIFTARGLEQLPDSGYIMAGDAQYLSSGWLVRTNRLGGKVFSILHGYAGLVSGADANSVARTLDGGYIFTGRRNFAVIKTDSTGISCDPPDTRSLPVDKPVIVAEPDTVTASPQDAGSTSGGTIYYEQLAPIGCLAGVSSVTMVAPGISRGYSLEQNTPNPVRHTTSLRFTLAAGGPVRLVIHDVSGRAVATPLDKTMEAGEYTMEFDASELAPGVYYYTLEAEGYSETRHMTRVP